MIHSWKVILRVYCACRYTTGTELSVILWPTNCQFCDHDHTGVAKLINKLNGLPFDDNDEHHFEVVVAM